MCTVKQESVSRQAYLGSLLAWSQGSGSSCLMPCRMTSLRLKKIYDEYVDFQNVRCPKKNIVFRMPKFVKVKCP